MIVTFSELVINNFKSFIGKHVFVLSRPPGLYYIAGQNKLSPELGANGCGKTTLWDALEWVLSEKTGRDGRPANEIIPWGMNKGVSSVALKMVCGNKLQTLTRTRRPRSLTLSHKGTERTIEQAEVWQLIGMSEQMFKRTIVLGQFGTFFLDLGPDQKAQMFNEALNLDVWLKASAGASKKHKSVAGDCAALELEISKLTGAREQLEQALKDEREAHKRYENEASAKLGPLKTRIKNLVGDFNKLLAVSEIARQARGQAENAPATLGGLKSWIANAEQSSAAMRKRLSALQAQRSALVAARDAADEEVGQYQAALKGDQTCPECGQKAPKQHLKDKLEEATHKFEIAKAKLVSLKDEQTKLSGELEVLEDALNKDEQTYDKARELEKEIEISKLEVERIADETNPHDATITLLLKRTENTDKMFTDAEALLTQGRERAEVCNYWIDAFKEIRLNLIDTVLHELEMAVEHHAGSLGLVDWGIKIQSERVNQSGTVTTAFTVLLSPPGQPPVKWESYSGGESQRWQLAMAFSLSEVILAQAGVAPNIEVLDEPTRGLSPEGIEALLEHLSERAQELGRAIYITEHHSLERGLFAQTIVIQKTKSGSKIVEG